MLCGTVNTSYRRRLKGEKQSSEKGKNKGKYVLSRNIFILEEMFTDLQSHTRKDFMCVSFNCMILGTNIGTLSSFISTLNTLFPEICINLLLKLDIEWQKLAAEIPLECSFIYVLI